MAAEYYDACVRGPEPPEEEVLEPTLWDRFIDSWRSGEESLQAGKDELEELLAGLPEDLRGMLLAGMPGLLFLLLLLLASPVGGAALLGSAGLLASLLAGWLYGQGHLGNDFNLLAAFASGALAWLFGFFGLQGVGEGALALRERRRGPGWARLVPQDGVPGDEESWWDKLLVALGVLAPAETLSWRGLGILARVPVKHPLVLALFGVGLLLLMLEVESPPASPNSMGLAADVQVVLAERQGSEAQVVEVPASGEAASVPPAGTPEPGSQGTRATSEDLRPTERQLQQFERQLIEHGRRSLDQSLNSLERRLAEHLVKLEQIKNVGGYTSSIEREIHNFQQQINAIKEVLGRNP